jgi:internalin A
MSPSRHEGESEAVVEHLKHAYESRGITLTLDDGALRYRESIRDFMRQLGAGGCIVVVLSKGYLESKNCMFELLEIEKNRDIRERIFPIVLRGTKIHDAGDRLTFIDYVTVHIPRNILTRRAGQKGCSVRP